MRSKDALNADFRTVVSDKAEMSWSGSFSPQARSYTSTGPPSTDTPKSSMPNRGSSQ